MPGPITTIDWAKKFHANLPTYIHKTKVHIVECGYMGEFIQLICLISWCWFNPAYL